MSEDWRRGDRAWCPSRPQEATVIGPGKIERTVLLLFDRDSEPLWCHERHLLRLRPLPVDTKEGDDDQER